MKRIILMLSATLIVALTSCNTSAYSKVKPENITIATTSNLKATSVPVMTFNKTSHDFGIIKEGNIVDYKFTFTNTGNSPLVIIRAKGSCGCTASKWSKEPIAPGAKGEILITFNSNGKPNLQNKQVIITTNTETGKEILKIKAMVAPKTKIITRGLSVSK